MIGCHCHVLLQQVNRWEAARRVKPSETAPKSYVLLNLLQSAGTEARERC